MKNSTRTYAIGNLALTASWTVLGLVTLLSASSAQGQATSGPAVAAATADDIPMPDLVGLPEEVADIIRKAHAEAKLHPNDSERIGELGMLSLRIAKTSTAATCMERASRLAPKVMKWYYYLGIINEDAYENGKAIEAYRKGFALDPNYAPLLVRAADLIRETDMKEATQLYLKALSLSPRNPTTHFGLGECARIEKRLDDAIKHYQKALEYAPKYGKAHGALARIYEAREDRTNAAIHSNAERSGREPPIVNDPHYIRLQCAGANGDWLLETAGQLLDAGELELGAEIISRAESIPKYQDQARKLLGRLAWYRQEYEKAVKYLSDYLGEFRADDDNRTMLAQALAELRRYDEAAHQLRMIVNNRPDDTESLLKLGIICLRIGENDADTHFKKILKKNGKHRDACVWLVASLVLKGDLDSTIKAYKASQRVINEQEDLDGEVLSGIASSLHFRKKTNTITDHSIYLKFAEAVEKAGYPASADRIRDPWSTISNSIVRNAGRNEFGRSFDLIQRCMEADEGGFVRNAFSTTVQLLRKASPAACDQFLKDNDRVAHSDHALCAMLAWTRATSADAELRNASVALKMAEHADKAAGHKNPEMLDTLAAAYAESGDFERAAKTVSEAIALCSAPEQKHRAELYQSRLKLYQEKKPYRN